jgi:GABA permease
MSRCLIVANQTLGGDELVELIRRRAQAEASEFFLVVPATPVLELVDGVAAMPVFGGVAVLPCSPEHARELAEERLATELAQLREAGVTVDGQVGDPDPVRAVLDTLKTRPADEIIVSTLPKRISRWLRQDLPHRLEHKTHLPVTHVGGSAEG